jgi:hypothetical protein
MWFIKVSIVYSSYFPCLCRSIDYRSVRAQVPVVRVRIYFKLSRLTRIRALIRSKIFGLCDYDTIGSNVYDRNKDNSNPPILQIENIGLFDLNTTIFECIWFGFMVLNATFNNISAISWRSVLLVEETRVPGENHRRVASHWQTLSHNVVSSTPRLSGVRTHNVSGDRH